MESPITAHGVSCELGGRALFSNINVSLPAGITGLVGPNGVGKTSLARILVGELPPAEGSVRRLWPVKLLPQRESPPAASVIEYLGAAHRSPTAQSLLQGVRLSARCNALSGGQWTRVRLARILDDSFLILDEPTSDLDREARGVVMEVLRQHRAGTLIISHDRGCLALCDQILELSVQGLASFGGGWQRYQAERDRERLRLEAELARARRARESSRASAQRQAEQRRKQTHRGRRQARKGGMPKLLAGLRKRQAEVTTGRLAVAAVQRAEHAMTASRAALAALKQDPVMYAGIRGESLPSQGQVATARCFNIHRGHWLFGEDLDFCWRGNLRLAITGSNGAGKSTLLQALQGSPFRTRGEFVRGDLRTVYLDQRLGNLDEAATVLQNVCRNCPGPEALLRNSLAQFLFTGDAVHQPVGTLSGGERLRAALAVAYLQVGTPQLMLLDEPTNNLDMANIEFLAKIAREFEGALLIVSHDEHFVARCGINARLELGAPAIPSSLPAPRRRP